MKARLKKIKKRILEPRGKVTPPIALPRADLIDICLLVILGLLPFTTVRLSISGTSVSIISCAIIVLFGIFLFTTKKHFTSIYRKCQWAHHFVLVVLLALCIVATMTNTSHGWGIFIEWFALPIIFGVIILHRLDARPESSRFIMAGLLLALAGVVVSGIIFYLHGIFTFDGRLYALWPSANHLALFSAPLLACCICFLMTCKGVDLKYRILLGFLALSNLIILYLTKSFGGLVALVGALTLIYVVQSKTVGVQFLKHKSVGVILPCAILGVLILGSIEKSRIIFENFERSSLASRITIYQVSIDMLRHSPLTGIGLGNFQEEYLSLQKYYEPYLEWAVPLPHNTFLAFWLYTGIGGLLIFLLATVRAISIFINTPAKCKQKMLPFLAAMVTIVIHGFVDTTFFQQDLAILYCLMVAVIFGLGSSQKDSPYSQLT